MLAKTEIISKKLIVSREEFFKIKNKQEKSVDDNLKLLVNSFGNDRRTYLYSKEFSEIKHNLAIEIIKNHDTFSGYKKTETYKKAYRPYDVGKVARAQVLAQLARLQQLERVQQLQRLQQLGQFEVLRVTNLDYKAFSNVENAILYLDPPYEGAKNKGYSIDKFDSQSFYDWAYKMSKKNIVIISSYEISDSRFECVYEFKKARSTLASQGYGDKTEKLFMVKKGEK